MRTLFILLTLCFLTSNIEAIDLRGHLSKEKLETATEEVNQAKNSISLEINSSFGDLPEALKLARRIYERKERDKLRVDVLIEEQAIGPAAIFPFLANKIETTLFVSWGDIAYGDEEAMPRHLLRSQVLGLISGNGLRSALVRAMVDPNYKPGSEKTLFRNAIQLQEGEALILSHKEMTKLGLIDKVVEAKKTPTEIIPPKSENLEKRLANAIKFKKEGKNLVGHIIIEDRTSGINQATWLYVKSALDLYKKIKPAFVILELNTPGGEVFAAQKISDALKDLDTQHGIPVVAHINNWAISAGAMLAYSCRFITIVKDASMGAAEPVHPGEGGKMQSASEKINSALRTDFANRASFFGRDPLLAEAMVDKDVILVKRHGKITQLDKEDQIKTSGPNQDELISAKGKLLTLSANEMIGLGVADLETPSESLPFITDAERTKGKWSGEKEALFLAPFFKDIPDVEVISYQMDWKTQLLAWLAHPVVSSLLFMGLMVGFYVEVSSPGFGVPGSIALLCLVLVILSSFALEAVQWLEVILLFAGVAMILVDFLLIPTFGILGIFGALFCVAGLFGLMIPGLEAVSFDLDTQTFNAAGEFAFERFIWLCGTFVLSLVIIVLLGKYALPKFAAFSRFVLKGHEQTAESGFVAGISEKKLPKLGSKGKVVGILRPTGKVEIKGLFYHARTSGEFLEEGTEVIVDSIDGSVLVVRSEGEYA